MKVVFVVTNARHHVDIVAPVSTELRTRGFQCELVDLSPLRGESVGMHHYRRLGIDHLGLNPRFNQNLARFVKLGQRVKSSGARKVLEGSIPRRSLKKQTGRERPSGVNPPRAKDGTPPFLNEIFWRLHIRPWLERVARNPRETIVVVLNDVAFPGDRIIQYFSGRRFGTVLLQEGVRFPVPVEEGFDFPYGGSGVATICAWGEQAYTHFCKLKAPWTTVRTTGAPHLSLIRTNRFASQSRRIGLFTNPIDALGYCSEQDKVRMVSNFLERSVAFLEERNVKVVIRPHKGEGPSAYKAIVDSFSPFVALGPPRQTIHEAISSVDAGIVLASTVGLEVLASGRRLGVLNLDGFGFPHDYVEAGVAVGMYPDNADEALAELLDTTCPGEVIDEYLERTISSSPGAPTRIADAIIDTLYGGA